jgi:hypothetical protein
MSAPAGTTATPNTTILSAAYNAFVADLIADLNAARPVTAGGTGGTSVITGWDGLAAKGTDIASASSINLTTATGPSVTITGTATIASVTLAEGSFRIVRAGGAFTWDASSSLLVNGSSTTDVTAAANDLFLVRGGASSVVSVVGLGSATTAAATTSAAGIVELATAAEALTGTDATRAVTPAGLYFPTGHLYGLTLSNNGTDATNDIDIAAGTCRDSTDTQNLDCAAMTKRLDATWSAGTGNGFRSSSHNSGNISDATYHIYACGKALGADQDYYADSSASPATVLGHLQAETGGADYLYVRRIASIIRSSGAILAFAQIGDEFRWVSPLLDVNASSGTSAQTQTLNVPTGVVVSAFGAFSGSGSNTTTYFSSLSQTDLAPSGTAAPLGIFTTDGTTAAFPPTMTNTSAQIRTRCLAGVTLRISTWGWVDQRGKL